MCVCVHAFMCVCLAVSNSKNSYLFDTVALSSVCTWLHLLSTFLRQQDLPPIIDTSLLVQKTKLTIDKTEYYTDTFNIAFKAV